MDMPQIENAQPDPEKLLFEPNISLNGLIEASTLSFFLTQLQKVRQSNGDLILELNTQGGDADVARRIAHEIKLFLRRFPGRGFVVGKTYVYSAGVTILSAFPTDARFLTEDTILLIHERRLEKSVELNGPIQASLQIIREQLALLETARALELEGFKDFVNGSDISVDELLSMAIDNCYMRGETALEKGLVAAVLR